MGRIQRLARWCVLLALGTASGSFAALEKRYWESHFLTSAETIRFLKSQYEQYKVLLGELGLAR